jgi:hypothetical protein
VNVALTDNVRVGQIWADLDKRSTGRQVVVLQVVRDVNGIPLIDPYAVVQSPTGRGRKTRIRLDRFRESTTGYRLVRDTPEIGPETALPAPRYKPARRARRTEAERADR